ncbi:glutamate ABC transporter substrate-binding protein [Amycolatopsis pigmentata]|uniref:Glutamate ABC transporter substrate-binding protein n=1 Tax=Amycolatopsis pigmentata TaxID=450801 RepID=A0ABW5FRE4_9PSEU
MRARAVVVIAAVFALGGCGTVAGTTVPVVAAQVPTPGGVTEAAAPAGVNTGEDCGDPLASLAPSGPLPEPGRMPPGSTMDRIVARGKLVVGVDQNTYNFGFRDPFTGQIQGFDIDMARAVARALFGDPSRIQLRALTSEQRIPAVRDGAVDIVVRTMSITCERRREVSFSAVYYDASQRLLVKRDSGITGAADLAGRRVCATKGSTSLSHLASLPARPVPVSVADWTDCLVMMQQRQVDAVSTDDVILAGLAAQDRYTEVVGEPLADEPYGMAIPQQDTDFVRFVNGVLERIKADGTWTGAYRHWLGSLLPGPVPDPPEPRYAG